MDPEPRVHRAAISLEAVAILNIALQIQNGWPWQSGFKLIGPTPDKKAS